MNQATTSVAAGKAVTLRFFAAIRETIGQSEEPWRTHAATVGDLRDELLARGGAYAQALARGRAVRVALNQVLCAESEPLPEGAEVAFFPPVTGG
ncbi:MAG: Molybdopterin synthase sulfur carrier subunit [Paracidovorax wautersii]|uniref:Molybdopterin synthase sulfur carrier subunit n=1 Tax=Paracidovorax wautersii TaxID=1177982 RepID=A0A7V8JNL4_9BURK|nr:MAG: Molybdopterin synthase sulfur carrier subunit [Paracidovorax wautersii]